MKKSYLYAMIILTLLMFVLAVFGTSNHFLKYYNPSENTLIPVDPEPEEPVVPQPENPVTPEPEEPTEPQDPVEPEKPVESEKPTEPEKPVEPEVPTEPEKPVEPEVNKKEIEGYTCLTDNCKILSGTSVIEKKYVFVEDNNIVLYDIKNKKTIAQYNSVTKSGSLYIAKKSSGKYELIEVKKTYKNILDDEFDNIKYVSDRKEYIIYDNKTSYIINSNGKKISSVYYAEIMQYNDNYIITKTDDGKYHIFNYSNNTEYLIEYINTERIFIELIGNYVGVITKDYTYKVYDFKNKTKLLGEVKLPDNDASARGRIKNNKIEIYSGDKVLKTIDL